MSSTTDIDILRLCLTTPGALTPVVVGPPGIGKSQRIRELAKSLNLDCEVLSPGERGEGAFGVVPVPNGDGYLHYPPPDWVKRFAESGRGIVFVDEINTAPPALQPALLGLVLDGRIGGYQLPPGVKRVAAMNPTAQAASGWDLPPALANRMQYLTWNAPSASEWADWLCEFAPKQDGAGFIKACSLASVYHRKNPGRLLEDPDKVLAARFPPAFCTPRSWETAVRMLASCFDAGENGRAGHFDLYPSICEGVLGKPAAVEFCTWLRQNDLPDPEDILADPSSWKIVVSESDKIFATCFAVAECAVQENASDGRGGKHTKKARSERQAQAWRALSRVMDAGIGKGLVAIAARRLSKDELAQGIVREHADVRRIVVALKDVCQAGGLL